MVDFIFLTLETFFHNLNYMRYSYGITKLMLLLVNGVRDGVNIILVDYASSALRLIDTELHRLVSL